MLLIGDVHGKIDEYNELTGKSNSSIQLGDLGFRGDYAKIEYRPNHFMVMGNHDDYGAPPKHSLGDYGVHEGIYFIRGAYSIDKQWRTPGIDWFEQEELSYLTFYEIAKDLVKVRPEIIVSHTCPKTVSDKLFPYNCMDLTAHGLDYIFSCYKPRLWVFGHHHIDTWDNIQGTSFVCLNELSTLEI